MTAPMNRTAGEFPGSEAVPPCSGPPVAEQGTPSPARAQRPARDGQAPGRGRAQTPAGGEPASRVRAAADSAPLAGLRTFTIAMPAGMELLNANDRDGHWARRRRVTAALREAAAWLARSGRIPALERAHILAVYEPPNRRRRDPANLYPSVKACVDGLVDAGILPDDDAKHLDGPDMRLGEVCRGGRLVLHITERRGPMQIPAARTPGDAA